MYRRTTRDATDGGEEGMAIERRYSVPVRLTWSSIIKIMIATNHPDNMSHNTYKYEDVMGSESVARVLSRVFLLS